MSGGEITEAEREILKKFREKVADIIIPDHHDEYYLRKWLIARKYNIENAEAMFRKHMNFMKVNDLDKIDEDYVLCEASDWFHTKFLGYDKEGSVVRIIHIGGSDLKGLVLSLSKMDCFRVAIFILLGDSRKQKRERENDTICHKQVYIFDLNGLSWRAILQRIVAERAYVLLRNYEQNHPESLKTVYIVNAPSFFSAIYSWLKTVLPESIILKVNIVSHDSCKAVLTEKIDPAILPATLGGLMIDEDGNPDCPSMYKKPMHVPLPESMYLFNQLRVLDKDPLAKKVEVEVGSFFKVETVITKPNSILQWDFQTTDYDISMILNYKRDQNSEYSVLMPSHRVESHKFPESGNLTCQEPGISSFRGTHYSCPTCNAMMKLTSRNESTDGFCWQCRLDDELVFDNSYSWFTKKELIYKVNVVLPNEKSSAELSQEY